MQKLALVAGINDYPGTGADLYGCVNDALDVTDALLARGYSVVTMLDRDATKKNYLGELRTMVASLGYRDRLVTWNSSHGSYIVDTSGDELDGRDEVLCMYDFRDGGLIVDDELFEIYSGLKFGRQVTQFSDSCHSGTVHRFVSDGLRPRFLHPEHFLEGPALDAAVAARALPARGVSRRSAVLMSGCADEQYSYDARFRKPDGTWKANGAFTYFALKTLREQTPRRMDQWHQAIVAAIPFGSYPQTPQLGATVYQRGRTPFG